MSSKYRHIQRTKNLFVRISEKFELTNFELSDRFCLDLIVNAHGTKKFVQISESSNCRVFELTGVDCIQLSVLATQDERLQTLPSWELYEDRLTFSSLMNVTLD